MAPLDPALLDKFRTSLKATLWCWALYWPGGGLLLVYGGLDPVSLLVVAGGIGAFLLILLSGALRTTSSRGMKELMLERPLYLVGVLVLLVAVVPLTALAEDVGIMAFSSAYLAAIVLALVRLVRLHRSIGGSPYKARTDQAFIALGIGAVLASLLFLDAWLGLGDARVPMPSAWIAVANWLSLLFPALLLLGTTGLREPLRSPVRGLRDGAASLAAPASAERGTAVRADDE